MIYFFDWYGVGGGGDVVFWICGLNCISFLKSLFFFDGVFGIFDVKIVDGWLEIGIFFNFINWVMMLGIWWCFLLFVLLLGRWLWLYFWLGILISIFFFELRDCFEFFLERDFFWRFFIVEFFFLFVKLWWLFIFFVDL